jgi:hypothetical protein
VKALGRHGALLPRCARAAQVPRSSSKVTLRSACCNVTFQVFQMFHLDVARVLSWYCKSRSWCCTCCSGYTRLFQVYVLNVSSVFSDFNCKCFI